MVKGKTEPKNKREGVDTCGQSISDTNAWNAPSSSLQKILDRTRIILQNREKMSPPTKSVAGETETNQPPKPGPSKKPSCKEEAEKLAIIGSNAWAKKKKKAELKKARKQRQRLQGPLYPYSVKINGIERGSYRRVARREL
jgi:hypothetical protein